MRSYELIFIVHPHVDEENLAVIVDKVQNLAQHDDGKIIQTKPGKMRQMAYPIQDQWEGQYVLMQLEMKPENVATLEHELGLIEQIMRHLIVRLEE